MNINILISEKSTKSRDPFLLFKDDLYYYVFSRDNKIYISVSNKIENLDKSKEIVVYDNQENLKNLWAPELHIIDNKCYIYVAADDGNNKNHRMYVLKNNSDNPINNYENVGIISDKSNNWAIDGTVFNYNGNLYFIWSGCNGRITDKQELFIAPMSSPIKISGDKVLISSPIYEWEKCGGNKIDLPYVNEGPSILKINDRIFIIYSASGCWTKDYCLGALELIDENPLLKSSWKKYQEPVFKSNNELIGPGHCTFTKDDKFLYFIFHSFVNENDLNLTNVQAKYMKIDRKSTEF